MWLGQESGHSNQQKTAPKQGGAPTVLDANGNLLNDGSRSYAYDALDRLIQVTQGMTTTLYGYTGDGDRLWQQTDGVTTTFTLDLNGALAQVLAQSQGSALTTVNFLPGIGQQQSGGYWTYFHADALGSVRDLSGVTGSAIGHVDYSPFGEIVNSTSMASWFGFTGEQQDSTSGLTYLRARYYDPALGRFLTPDSLIPDITNGQALNAYAYVYNDPINLVDPSGHMGVFPYPKNAIIYGAQKGIQFLDWWQSKPDDCRCNRKNENALIAFDGLYYPEVAGLGYLTKPATKVGEYSIEYLSTSSFTWESAGTYVRDVSDWKIGGTPSYVSKPGASLSRQTVRNTKLNSSLGMTGFAGSVLLAGFLDGAFQFADDINSGLCLSPQQYAWRTMFAFMFGMLSGAIAAAATVLAVYFGAPLLLAAGIGIGVGLGVNWVIKNKTPYNKDYYLDFVLHNM